MKKTSWGLHGLFSVAWLGFEHTGTMHWAVALMVH
jgi:hypothetical protein